MPERGRGGNDSVADGDRCAYGNGACCRHERDDTCRDYGPSRSSRQPAVREGQTLAVSGVILHMPDGMDDRLKAPGVLNDEVYLYANKIAS